MKIISDGKSIEVPSCGALDIYSTEEHVVGRWIDGKPLYRVTVTGGNFATNGDWQKLFDIHSYNVDTLADVQATYVQTVDKAKKSMNCKYFDMRIFSDGWFWISGPSGGAFDSWIVNLLYTKTTDQATIELPAALTVSVPASAAAPQSDASAVLDAGSETKEV